MQSRIGFSLSIVISTFALTANSPAQAPGGKNRAKVDLLASADAVIPGKPLDLAVRFKIDKGWHIYWQNSGESGLPPRVKWNLPTGLSAGDAQFPVPKRHRDPAGLITTNIHEGEPSLLFEIKSDAGLTGSDVRLSAHVEYLVCAENCLRESADVELKLPVRAGGEAKSANETVFKAARNALPASKSRYVTLKPSMDPPSVKPGDKFTLSLLVDVSTGFHIQAPNPSVSSLFGADLFLNRLEAVYWQKSEFPPAKSRDVKSLGTLKEYDGAVSIKTVGEVDGEAKGPVQLGGVFVFQACDSDGHCFPPEAVQFSLSSQVAAKPSATGEPDARQANAAAPTPAGPVSADGTSSGTLTPGPSSSRANGASSPSLPTRGGDESFFGSTFAINGKMVPFWEVLLLGLLGGLILNVMPCVLPVISIKILSFVQQSKEEPARVFRLGLTFALGMLVSFWALAAAIIALKATGQQFGWGFQFQSPRFVIGMMALMFVFGLSLLGVFMINLPGAAIGRLSAAEEHEGYLGAFMKGVMGTILATPCTAPYLGSALGVAFVTTNDRLLAIFSAVGFGMASPFIILSAFPSLLRFLPRPGAWMEHFKQLMGFFMMATVVWLMFTLGDQIGVPGLARTSGFLIALALACWILGRQTPLTPVGRRLLAWTTALGISVAGWWMSFEGHTNVEAMVTEVRLARVCPCADEVPIIEKEQWTHHIPWQPWSKGRAETLAKMGYTVYVDYTATWCATCLANKAATLETERVRTLMRDQCVVPMKADFTLQDPDILADLMSFGRSGVPTNVIYPAGRPRDWILMPEQLIGRTDFVVEKLQEAGASLTCTRTAMRP